MEPLRELKNEINEIKHIVGWFLGFCSIGIHMTITFYLTLFGYSLWLGPDSPSPELMEFVVIWHLMALPAWAVKALFIRIARFHFGKLFLLMMGPLLVYLFRIEIAFAIRNISRWMGEAF